MKSLIKDLYQYRELFKTNVQKEIRGKYKGAWLGVIWSYLNPVLMLCVYAVVFSKIMKLGIPNYTMFLFTAILPWNFFTATVTSSAFAITSNGSIIKKVYFPREIIPISVVTSGLINYLISCVILLVFLIVSGVGISFYMLYFPIVVAIQYVLLLGISFIVSSVTVYARDIEHLISVLLMALMYGTPILYSYEMVPKSLAWLINLNPMTSIINAYRDCLFFQQRPDLSSLAIVGIAALALFFIGLFIFQKLQRNFAEEV